MGATLRTLSSVEVKLKNVESRSATPRRNRLERPGEAKISHLWACRAAMGNARVGKRGRSR